MSVTEIGDPMSSVRDVVIVGSGPAGLTAAIYASRAGLAPLVVGGSIDAGGALMGATEVENFPGFPSGVSGPNLMESMRLQAERFGAEVLCDDVTEFDLAGPEKTVTVGDGTTIQTKTVILALGSSCRELGVPNEKRLSGQGVSWCATCDGFFFRDQDVLVVGGGDSAMQEAVFLSKTARTVTVVHRRDRLRASIVMAERAMACANVQFAWNTEVVDVLGLDTVAGAVVRDTLTGQERELRASGLFVSIGHEPRTGVVAEQVNLDGDGYIAVDGRSSRTNLPGVFACGDAVDDTYRQAVTAAGSGCIAALDAQRYLTRSTMA